MFFQLLFWMKQIYLSSGFQDTNVPTRYFTSNKNLKRQIIISYLNASLKSAELIDHRLEARQLQRVGTMIAKAPSPLVISLDLGKDHKADQKSLESCWWHMTAKVCGSVLQCVFVLSSSDHPNWSRQMAAPAWGRFYWNSFPVKRKFFLFIQFQQFCKIKYSDLPEMYLPENEIKASTHPEQIYSLK